MPSQISKPSRHASASEWREHYEAVREHEKSERRAALEESRRIAAQQPETPRSKLSEMEIQLSNYKNEWYKRAGEVRQLEGKIKFLEYQIAENVQLIQMYTAQGKRRRVDGYELDQKTQTVRLEYTEKELTEKIEMRDDCKASVFLQEEQIKAFKKAHDLP